jgi:hypothetical protein
VYGRVRPGVCVQSVDVCVRVTVRTCVDAQAKLAGRLPQDALRALRLATATAAGAGEWTGATRGGTPPDCRGPGQPLGGGREKKRRSRRDSHISPTWSWAI